MSTQTAFVSQRLIRSIAIGVLLSMLLTYGAHVFGTWDVENYRPDSQTTSSVIVYNKCAVFGATHVLRPNYPVEPMNDGISTTKLTGSFMNFFDGHVVAMVILAIGLGLLIFAISNRSGKTT